MKKGDFEEPEDKLEIVDVADISGLNTPRSVAKPDPDAVDLDYDANNEFPFPEDALLPEIPNFKTEKFRPKGRPANPAKNGKTGAGIMNKEKPLFALSVAAEILGLHPRTLRIYEELKLVVPYRTETQRRRYSQNDINKIKFIQFLTQNRRVNLEGVRIILYMLDDMRQLGVTDPLHRIFKDYQES